MSEQQLAKVIACDAMKVYLSKKNIAKALKQLQPVNVVTTEKLDEIMKDCVKKNELEALKNTITSAFDHVIKPVVEEAKCAVAVQEVLETTPAEEKVKDGLAGSCNVCDTVLITCPFCTNGYRTIDGQQVLCAICNGSSYFCPTCQPVSTSTTCPICSNTLTTCIICLGSGISGGQTCISCFGTGRMCAICSNTTAQPEEPVGEDPEEPENPEDPVEPENPEEPGEVETPAVCSTCNSAFVNCSECNGTGNNGTCTMCNGTGFVCPNCNGTPGFGTLSMIAPQFIGDNTICPVYEETSDQLSEQLEHIIEESNAITLSDAKLVNLLHLLIKKSKTWGDTIKFENLFVKTIDEYNMLQKYRDVVVAHKNKVTKRFTNKFDYEIQRIKDYKFSAYKPETETEKVQETPVTEVPKKKGFRLFKRSKM